MATEPKSIEELLRERARLDAELERFQRLVTVMFTDIAGSTKYFDQHGDPAGMAMLQGVNDTLQPLVRTHEGKIVKTIGDAIMAYFENPVEAVRCAIGMQRSMVDFNADRPKSQQVLVRVALNLGIGMLKDNDVFGDVVNVCSRIEHSTEAGKICVSPSVVEATRKDIGYKKIGEVEMRGKAQKMDLYEVLWREGEKVEKAPPPKLSGEQLALATGTRLGLDEEVRAAIAEAVKGRAPTTTLPAIEKKKFALVEVKPDGSVGKRFPLTGASAVVGREKGEILFPDDSLMSRQHAVFTTLGGALYVEDLGSANGVFIRIRAPYTLQSEDVVVLGRQMFRFRLLPGTTADQTIVAPPKPAEKKEKKSNGKAEKKSETKAEKTSTTDTAAGQLQGELVRLLKGGQEETHYPLQRGETTFGRTRGTYTFPDDPYLSRQHASLKLHAPLCVIEDMKSMNGTFVRIRERHLLDVEDTVLIGGQLLHVIAE